MLILLYLYEQNEFGFPDSTWIKEVKNENFVMVSRDRKIVGCIRWYPSPFLLPCDQK